MVPMNCSLNIKVRIIDENGQKNEIKYLRPISYILEKLPEVVTCDLGQFKSGHCLGGCSSLKLEYLVKKLLLFY